MFYVVEQLLCQINASFRKNLHLMAKIVQQNHITAEKGVTKFASYCINHIPVILFREETKHDYGVDGEIELTRTNDEGKTEATGEIIKIQLKSTALKSYVTNETNNSFDFIAKDNDLKYWKEHSLPVVVVIYFVDGDKLYAKKIDKSLVLKNRKTHKIIFDKSLDVLNDGDEFQKSVGQKFSSRVNFDVSENLYFNYFKVNLPLFIYQYDCLFTNVEDIFSVIKEYNLSPLPQFILIGKKLYCLEDLTRYNRVFRENVLENQNGIKTNIKKFINSGLEEKKIIIRILNRYLNHFFYKKGLRYQKEYNRYYFAKFNEESLETKEKLNSKREVFRFERSKGKSGRTDSRAVVSKYTYYETSSFFRHLAFQHSYEWIDSNLFMLIHPKYFYTEDGNNPLENKERITRLTNTLKQSERNTQYLNHLFFLRNYLDKGEIKLFYEDVSNKLSIGSFEMVNVNFGIMEDKPTFKVKIEKDPSQMKLFEDI